MIGYYLFTASTLIPLELEKEHSKPFQHNVFIKTIMCPPSNDSYSRQKKQLISHQLSGHSSINWGSDTGNY